MLPVTAENKLRTLEMMVYCAATITRSTFWAERPGPTIPPTTGRSVASWYQPNAASMNKTPGGTRCWSQCYSLSTSLNSPSIRPRALPSDHPYLNDQPYENCTACLCRLDRRLQDRRRRHYYPKQSP